MERRLHDDGAPRLLVETLAHQYRQLLEHQSGYLRRAAIEPVTALPDADALPAAEGDPELLARVAMIKLNGGLGTGMGLESTKSLIPVREGLSFLDIIIRQVLCLRRERDVTLPLLLMNSFVTHAETQDALRAYPELARGQGDLPVAFQQHRVPKIRQDDYTPLHWPSRPALEWCPPGHGDLYTVLCATGLLARLLERGFSYAFISNADNLGARLDPRILRYLAERQLPFLMEVADRHAADSKGGHLARGRAGQLLLREAAQCPPDETDDFQDIARYRYFNTNNLWLNLPALRDRLAGTGPVLDLPLIVNSKTADPNDPASPPVYQLETAMGAAIALFPGAEALRVPRTHFAPVKSTSDLLAVRSDLYELTAEWQLRPRWTAEHELPVVDLDARFYKRLQDFEERFPKGAPLLRACRNLKILGDIRFGGGVVLEGRVNLAHEGSLPAQIPDGARLTGRGEPMVV